jgi:aquaporin Z
MPLREHLTEYAIEGWALGMFMFSASLVSVLLDHPASPLHQAIAHPLFRRLLAGVAMGLTLVALVYSPFGRRSGAHMNPVVTLTFLRLGKIAPGDACGYVVAQFLGASIVMVALAGIAMPWIADPAVNYVRTLPGPEGSSLAFAAEAAISFGMMTLVLNVSNSARWHAWTGVCAGLLVALYITVEAPLSGMSMNPARTLGPAVAARSFDALWIYFAAPLVGMLAAAELFVHRRGVRAVVCAKLHHDDTSPCIFRCGHQEQMQAAAVPAHSHQSELTLPAGR